MIQPEVSRPDLVTMGGSKFKQKLTIGEKLFTKPILLENLSKVNIVNW